MKKSFILLLFAAFILLSCNSNSSKKENITPELYSVYLQKGNDIANLAQSVLLSNVGNAIQQGGPEYAVEFCNINASEIIDSLNQSNNCIISRVSEKNRNPHNVITNDEVKGLWNFYADKEINTVNDTIIQLAGKLVFYKPIWIGMPACLKCHGVIGEEIDEGTYKKIQNLYPEDLATGYKLNDFRGMWKIEFNED